MIFSYSKNDSNDRAIRRAIAELRERGSVITSASDHAGYMLTTDHEAVKHYLNESIKRAKKIMRTARKVRQAYGLKDQMSLMGGTSRSTLGYYSNCLFFCCILAGRCSRGSWDE